MPKLDKWENESRKAMRNDARNYGARIEWFPEMGVCVVSCNMGNTVQATASRCAPEDKARRKVGEFHALNRWFDGKVQAFSVDRFDAYEFASMVTAGEFDEKGRFLIEGEPWWYPK